MRKFAAGIALALMLALGGVTACSSAPPQPPVPSVWTVSYMGTNYCPYEFSPYETQMYGYTGQCTPVAFPSLSMVPAPGSLQWALMGYATTYSGFYYGDWWFYHYYAPLGARYHLTLISYSSYMGNVSMFDRTYASQIRVNASKATYIGKSGKVTGAYKFPTTNTKDAAKIWTNNGSSTGRVSTSTGKTGGGGMAPRAPAPRAPVVRAPAIHVGR